MFGLCTYNNRHLHPQEQLIQLINKQPKIHPLSTRTTRISPHRSVDTHKDKIKIYTPSVRRQHSQQHRSQSCSTKIVQIKELHKLDRTTKPADQNKSSPTGKVKYINSPSIQHHPHPCIQRSQTLKVDFSKMMKQDFFFQSAQQDIKLEKVEVSLKRTIKKEKLYDPRTSVDTHSSQLISKRALPPQKGPFSLLSLPTKTLLQDAKSIISLQQSSIQQEEMKIEESILLKREIDMYSDIRRIDEIVSCEVFEAVDDDGNQVTLKCFAGETYTHELQILRKVDQLNFEIKQKRILQLKHIFMEQPFKQKSIIFVYPHFQMTLQQYIRSLISEQKSAFIIKLNSEISQLLMNLRNLQLELESSLQIQDFVVCEGEWKLHNLSRLIFRNNNEKMLQRQNIKLDFFDINTFFD